MAQKKSWMFLLLIVWTATWLTAQVAPKPYLIEATLDGKPIAMGSAQRITTGNTIEIRLSNVGGAEYTVSAKTLELELASNLGGSKKVASFKMVKQADGSYAAKIGSSTGAQGIKFTYSISGIRITKNGVAQKVNIPLRERCLLVESY